MRHLFILLTLVQAMCLDEGWRFSLGDASSPSADFGAGTEYFNYLTKAASIHNEGPYTVSFDDASWAEVRIPHDWVSALPFDSLASHSHGYRTVGWRYPSTSAGWYRLSLPQEFERGRHYELRFEGVFRDARFWFNGVYMGSEPSGYAVSTFDITPYIDYDGENVLCVRADASLEEGWFYEGAGIYRPVYLVESAPVHALQDGVWTEWDGSSLELFAEIENSSEASSDAVLSASLVCADGSTAAVFPSVTLSLAAREKKLSRCSVRIPEARIWDVDDPYLYTLVLEVNGERMELPVGIRSIEFNAGEGFLLNGRKLTLKGVNLHQDHAGVGSAMPDALIRWRLERLMELGVNAIRCSHNPASPSLLDECDRLGILVIDENRLMGVNGEHRRLLENMVRVGRRHPSVILWSVGNEEWGLENDPRGLDIVGQMQSYVHLLDSTRPTTAANAGGTALIGGLQVVGFNYIVQNDVAARHAAHPDWILLGSEETTGCGTRGVYFPEPGRMVAINRSGDYPNVIQRGWQFYRDNPWSAGVFFWTGFDYMGEPNPLVWPAVSSEFGILDYCGFPKDEAWYLKAAWTDEPVLHVFPHWNLQEHEGEMIDVWVYSNCDEVLLRLNGRSLGRKTMPRDGYLSWQVPYRAGKLVATGYRSGKKVMTTVLETTGPAVAVVATADRSVYNADGRDVAVITLRAVDSRARTVPDARFDVELSLGGEGRIIGVGNGDPAYHGIGTSCVSVFNGYAQVLVQTTRHPGPIELQCRASSMNGSTLSLQSRQ